MARLSQPIRAFTVHTAGQPPRIIHLQGRDRWALERLIAAGGSGVTAFTDPAPRWAAYVHNLRRAGLVIETITESHGGPFAGHHARYVLRSVVTPGAERAAA